MGALVAKVVGVIICWMVCRGVDDYPGVVTTCCWCIGGGCLGIVDEYVVRCVTKSSISEVVVLLSYVGLFRGG